MFDGRDARKKMKIAIAALLAVDVIARGDPVFSARGIGTIAPGATRPVVAGIAAKDARGGAAARLR